MRRLAAVFALLLAACTPRNAPPSGPAPVPPPSAPPAAVPPASTAPPVVSGPPARPTVLTPAPTAAPALPPIPLVEGPLAITVVLPPAGSDVPATDSSFVIGSLGNGKATLTINGVPARVYPNGAFVGWLRTPRAISKPAFDLVAVLATDTVRSTVSLREPTLPKPFPTTGRLVIDSSEFAARRNLILREEEATTVRIKAPTNASVTLMAAGQRLPLTQSGQNFSRSVNAGLLRSGGTLLVARGGDTLRVPVAPTEIASAEHPHVARLGTASAAADSDNVIYGRPLANDTYKWFFLPGTAVEVTGRTGGYTRLRLDSQLEAWVDNADVAGLATVGAESAPALRVTSNARMRSTPQSADLILPVTALPTFFVEQFPDRIELTLYNTRGNTDVVNMPTSEVLVRHVTWEQLAPDRVRFTLHLGAKSTGYLPLWEHGSFVLRVRRAPAVDADQPLRGRSIVLDPGQPPAGATGPTSLYEGQVALWVAERAKAMLESRGAHVVLTRTTMDTLGLQARRVISRRADADAFVSIHLNAYPEGVNPFTATRGTGTYFYRASAESLARAVQRGLVATMGLKDEGVFFRSLGVTIQTWVPSILCEGAYVVVPEQEAALRTAEFQDRYARGIVDGLEAYFRELR